MAAEPRDPLDAALRLARAFESAGLSYALGGALAYNLWGVPRATIDVDVNLFVPDEELERAWTALESLGIAVDRDGCRREAASRGMFVVRFGPFRIDLFTPSIDFSWEAERTRVRHRIDDQDAWFLSAEALAVFKLLFFRGKDVVDLERLVAVQRERLDTAYVRARIVEMMGADDDRVRRWDAIVAAAGAVR